MNLRERFASETKDLSDSLRTEEGSVALGCVAAVALAPVGAAAFGYLGAGIGWLTGNIVDIIPYVNQAAPYIAHKTGFIQDSQMAGLEASNFNVEFYQASGAVSGFWSGFWFPFKVLTKVQEKNRI